MPTTSTVVKFEANINSSFCHRSTTKLTNRHLDKQINSRTQVQYIHTHVAVVSVLKMLIPELKRFKITNSCPIISTDSCALKSRLAHLGSN